MKLLKKYIFLTYSQTFFPIFSTLYIITSIIFLVKIATLTSVIQINFLELLELYSYSIPTIIFYTLPVSIFVSIVLTLSKLSSEYELMVITSFGLNPINIIKLILPSLILSTLLLLLISLALIPKADYMKKDFLNQKKTEAQFNIKPSEYGQVFGDWLIYVKDEDKGIYKDIVLFQQNGDEDNFIISKEAIMKNENLSLSLNLKDGTAVRVTDKVNQIDFKKMIINNYIKPSTNINSINDLILYWKDIDTNKRKESKFSFFVLSSIFPLVSILFIIVLGYFNPRYDKNYSTSFSLILTTLFVVLSQKLSKDYGLSILYIIPPIWILLSVLFYRLKIKPSY
ncbi:MAG: LptF/LptG family permease [Campylobacterota bacterium]|nr:LptF/LptG family permease [Campylobacterota bacterium]